MSFDAGVGGMTEGGKKQGSRADAKQLRGKKKSAAAA